MSTLHEVLDHIALPSRSNRQEGFYDRSRMDAIQTVLTGSNYNVVASTKHMTMYGKKKPQDLAGARPILISSHADIVPYIKHPSSTLENSIYHGTYDNMGTNAAAITLMLDEGEHLPDNIYFAFTDEEETGACLGAKDASAFLTKLSKTSPFCIALDVTDEGFRENALLSIEGLSGKEETCREVVDAFLATEGQQRSAVSVPNGKHDKVRFPKEYDSGGYFVFDEGMWYGQKGYDSVSFCLPSTGNMHSDAGLDVKEPVFEGYVIAMASFLYSYTHTHPALVEAYRTAKDNLVLAAGEIHIAPPKNRWDGWESWGTQSTTWTGHVPDSYTSGDRWTVRFDESGQGSFTYGDYDDYDDEEESLMDDLMGECAELASYYRDSPSEKKLFMEQAKSMFEGMFEFPEQEISDLFDEFHTDIPDDLYDSMERSEKKKDRNTWNIPMGADMDAYLAKAREHAWRYPDNEMGREGFLQDARAAFRDSRMGGAFPEQELDALFSEEQGITLTEPDEERD